MSFIEYPHPLPKNVAERVRELRQGKVTHSWRRIAEVICEEFPAQPLDDGWGHHAKGNQLYGRDLCERAGLGDE